MSELTPEQKARKVITGDPMGEPYYEHEGEQVVRWITGGTLPDAYITQHLEGERIVARCATCRNIIGYLPANFDREETARALTKIRLAGHEMHKPAGWPRLNISTTRKQQP